MIDRLPNALIGKRILRIEAQLRRKGILKWVPAAACSSSWDIIHTLFKKGKKIIRWYLRRMQPADTPCRRYETAVAQAQAIRGEKTRTRILYLLKKASDCHDLDAALEKMQAVFADMLELAQVEKSMQLLAQDIEKTRRRVNALEYVMIPETEQNIRYITMKLDENDRSTTTRLMKVKDMLLKLSLIHI